MWRQGGVPQDFKDVIIVHLYQRKENRQILDNHRVISLLNIVRKIFARILLNRHNKHLEQGLLPEFRRGAIKEMRTHLYSTFVDLTKAFDTLNRETLWRIVQKFGRPERFTQMLRQLHDGMMARVTDSGAAPEAFAGTSGGKPGCILALTLFSLTFAATLMDAYRDEHPGIPVAHRADGQLLNQFQSRVSTPAVHELLVANDCALNATSEGDVRRSMDLFAAACVNFGLIINTEKEVVTHQPSPDAAYNALQINVNGAQPQVAVPSPILAALSLAAPKSTMKWPAGFPKSAKPSTTGKTQSPSSSIIISASTSAGQAPAPVSNVNNPDVLPNINLTTANTSDLDSDQLVFIAIARSPHTSAWSVTCESIAQSPVNQYLEHQPAFATSTSTLLTTATTSAFELAYQVTCAFMKICAGGHTTPSYLSQPAPAPNINITHLHTTQALS
ncbi:hypothetical protein SprV_0501965300 [Sparganum proliferum]